MAGFDTKAFMRAQFQPRTAEIAVPGLQHFFAGSNPVWIVRGLTASELARSLEAAANNKALDAIVQAALSKSQALAEEVRAQVGLSDDVPGEVAKRLEQFVTASVDPVMDRAAAVRFADTYPIEFYQITNKIVELTGLGMDIKKPKASGKIPSSET